MRKRSGGGRCLEMGRAPPLDEVCWKGEGLMKEASANEQSRLRPDPSAKPSWGLAYKQTAAVKGFQTTKAHDQISVFEKISFQLQCGEQIRR